MKLSHTILLSPAITRVFNRIILPSCGLFLAGSLVAAADVSGEWEFAIKRLGDTGYMRVNLRTDGSKITGNLNELKLEGTNEDGKLTFNAKRPNGDNFGDFTGVLHENSIEGTADFIDDGKVTWSAKRAATPPSAPKVHDFEPTDFHRVFSDA